MKKLVTFLLSLLVSLFLVAPVFAQTPQASGAADIAKKYNVTFPISELGGCINLDSCRNFCEDPVNSSSCISYAKQKGFYQENKFEVKDNTLAAAKSQLGCDSYAACLNFCEVPANFDKCDSFAKSQGLVGGRVDDPSKTQVISKAREVLGCDSTAGCQSYCSKEENRQKCSDFAKTVGLHGGEHQVGPGGCTSETTCKAFCSDPNNYQVCSGFTTVAGGTFTGPGGCNSEASCRSYCSQHEDECKKGFGGPGGSPPPGYNPQEMCNKTPNCSWTGSTCQCGFYGETEETAKKAEEYAAYCQANPDKCKSGQPGSFDTSAQRQEFESYCSKNPDKCKPPPGVTTTYSDPATECTKYGCSWNGSFCQCSSISGGKYTPPPPGSGGTDPATGCRNAGGTWNNNYCQMPTSGSSTTSAPSGMSRDQQEAGCKSCGGTCSWSGDFCNCKCGSTGSSGGSTSTPQPTSQSQPSSAPQPTSAPAQESTPAPQPAQSSTPAPSPEVHGVSTVRNLIQSFFDWFLK